MLRQRSRREEEGNLSPSAGEEKPILCTPRVNRFSTVFVALAIIVVWLSMYNVAFYLNERLPPIRHRSDEADDPGRFVGERARNFLLKLAGIGVKVTGSKENEVVAVELIEDEILTIIKEANPLHQIEYDHQTVSGSFYLAFSIGLMSHYSDVQNLIVKIGPRTNVNSSLLVNCHFDSAPTSPGASDDGLNCAVMLEVLRQLSWQNTSLDHNVIFLFNGAEETPLQASHGFISQHKWAKEVKAFVNLESCGAGGREVLFQAGPHYPWLVELYGEAAEHPSGSVLAEDIFQSGLVPSDTDFRIFRDFGNVPGLDFAHCNNGYVYHTRYDDIHHIKDGVFQHTGDNILAIVRKFAKSDILANSEKYKEGRVVYFDLAGLYIFVYSELTGIILNLATVMLSVYSILQNVFTYTSGMQRKEVGKQLLMSVLVPFIGLYTGVCFSLLTAVLLDTFSSTHGWYSKPYLILTLYFAPTLMAFCLPPLLINKMKSSNLCDGVRVQLYCNGVQLLWTTALFIAVLTGFRSSYLLMVAVLIPAVVNCTLTLFNYQHSVTKWLTVYVSSSIIPATYFVYVYILAMKLFVPISGRSGPSVNPELVIGVLASLLCALIFAYVTPLILLVWKPWKLIFGLFFVYITSLIVIIATPYGFPFSLESPQRVLMFHVHRSLHNIEGAPRTESGLWLFHIDRRAPETYSAFPWFKNPKNIDADCQSHLFCGLPFYYTRSIKLEKNPGSWIPVPSPTFENETSVKLDFVQQISHEIRRYNFSIVGPHQMRVFLSPRDGVELVNWDFGMKPNVGPEWGSRPTYIISHTSGLEISAWNFSIDFQRTKIVSDRKDANTPYLDLAVAGHYVDGSQKQREDLEQYLQSVPVWAHVTAWAASYKSYVF